VPTPPLAGDRYDPRRSGAALRVVAAPVLGDRDLRRAPEPDRRAPDRIHVTPPALPTDATSRPRRRRAALAVTIALAVLLGAAGLASCSSESTTGAPAGEAPIETLPPLDDEALEAAGGAPPLGGCDGGGGGGGGDATAPAGGSPLAAPGARQLPGPGVTVTSVPSSATSIVMQTPGNPDEASPARSTEGVGTPTPPYVIVSGDADGGDGGADPDEDSTTTSTAAPDTGEPAVTAGGCGGGL
jgi:hypothetical protein